VSDSKKTLYGYLMMTIGVAFTIIGTAFTLGADRQDMGSRISINEKNIGKLSDTFMLNKQDTESERNRNNDKLEEQITKLQNSINELNANISDIKSDVSVLKALMDRIENSLENMSLPD